MSRRPSEVDPLDNTAQNEYDVAGGAQLPPVHIVRPRSNTGGSTNVRSRSSSFLNSAFGRRESVEEGSPGDKSAGVFRDADKEFTIEEHPDESESTDPTSEQEKNEQTNEEGQDEEKSQKVLDDERPKSSGTGTDGGDDGDQDVITAVEKKKRKHATIRKVCFMFAKAYLLLFCLFILILSIYWGSMYNRASHYHKIKYLVVVGETNTTTDSIPPLYSLTLTNLLESSTMQRYGNWDVRNHSSFAELASSHNNTLREEVIRQVHHQNYWGGIYIPQNITYNYYESLRSGDNFSEAIEFIYETGRNPQGIPTYVVSTIQSIEKEFVSLGASSIVERLTSNLSADQINNTLSTNPQLLSSLWWTYTDNRPSSGSIVIAIVQVCLLYLLVLSFHQFNFASATHQMIATKIHTNQYLLYHITTSQIAYVVLSLIYSLMTLAFQVPVNKTFGRSGFLVEWAFVFLTMSALGGVNENAAIQIFARYKFAIGFWVVFHIVINVSVIFSPLVVMNNFYRYGYAMPMYQGNELLKVVFFNTYKGNMGRNIGILIVWIVLMNIILPFNLRNVRSYTRKVEERARAALEKNKGL